MCDRLFGDVVNSEAQCEVQQHQRMNHAVAKAKLPRKPAARIERVGIEKRRRKHREHPVVDGHLPRMVIDIADSEVVKQPAVFRSDYSNLWVCQLLPAFVGTRRAIAYSALLANSSYALARRWKTDSLTDSSFGHVRPPPEASPLLCDPLQTRRPHRPVVPLSFRV